MYVNPYPIAKTLTQAVALSKTLFDPEAKSLKIFWPYRSRIEFWKSGNFSFIDSRVERRVAPISKGDNER